MSLLESRVRLIELCELGFGILGGIVGCDGSGGGCRSLLLYLLERVIKIFELVFERGNNASNSGCRISARHLR
jgi:hypothetical protein